MKFRLVIDKTKEEELVATVHRRTSLIDRVEELVTGGEQADSFAVYSDDEIRLITFAETQCITVVGGKTYAVADDGRQYLIKSRLYEVEKRLPVEFIRINKSSIANRLKIKRFKTAISGAVDVEFTCGFTEYVSRRCFAQIRKMFL